MLSGAYLQRAGVFSLQQPMPPGIKPPQHPRKTAVEAAIARAKARKLEQQQANAEPEQQVDPRKAAVL
nr:hypothetical protein [Escherichia coli]